MHNFNLFSLILHLCSSCAVPVMQEVPSYFQSRFCQLGYSLHGFYETALLKPTGLNPVVYASFSPCTETAVLLQWSRVRLPACDRFPACLPCFLSPSIRNKGQETNNKKTSCSMFIICLISKYCSPSVAVLFQNKLCFCALLSFYLQFYFCKALIFHIFH